MAAKFDLAIALTLSSWSALTIAVQNSWGGPLSSEKRDWFAGAVSTLMEETPDADVDYVEEFLLQVMNDEFETYLDDGSAEGVAAKIVGLRKQVWEGDFATVDQMYARWQERERKGARVQIIEGGEMEGQETDWDSDDFGDEEGEDTEMGDAEEVLKVREKPPPPEVDEDGFTKVVGRRKR